MTRHAELKDGLGKAGLKEIPPDLAAIMDGPVAMFIHQTGMSLCVLHKKPV